MQAWQQKPVTLVSSAEMWLLGPSTRSSWQFAVNLAQARLISGFVLAPTHVTGHSPQSPGSGPKTRPNPGRSFPLSQALVELPQKNNATQFTQTSHQSLKRNFSMHVPPSPWWSSCSRAPKHFLIKIHGRHQCTL